MSDMIISMEDALYIISDKDEEANKLKAGIFNLGIRHQQARKDVEALRRELSDERLKCREMEEQIRELERTITASGIETSKVSYDEMKGFNL